MTNRPASQASESRLFRVAVLGADSKDQIMFNRVLHVTRYRPRRYELIPIGERPAADELRAQLEHADIIVVNINNPNAVILWNRVAARMPQHKKKPVLRLTRDTNPVPNNHLTIAWPLNPSRVIQTLDRYTVDQLHYAPERDNREPALKSAPNVIPMPRPETPPPRPTGRPETNRRRALIADDSIAVRRQLEIEFERLGCDLDVVADGEAATAAADKSRYDIIFLDIIMPGIDGYAVCRHIKKTRLNRLTPVVLLTSKSSHFDKLKGRLAGCDNYLTKPINHNEFCSVTEQHFEPSPEK